MEIKKQMERHEHALRTLELIEIEEGVKEKIVETYTLAKKHNMEDLKNHQMDKMEICDMVIKRLTERYYRLCSQIIK